jgi:hypothetical protein
MKILSTLSKVATIVPKPPLSLLRLGAASTPVGLGLVVGSVVAVKAFEHWGEIKSALGNLVNNVKAAGSPSVSTLGELASKTESKPAEESSMLMPVIIGAGIGLVVLFVIMRAK